MDSKDADVKATQRDDQRTSQTGVRYYDTSGELQPEYSNLRIYGA